MSESESPQRESRHHTVSIDDIRQISGAATPHFAMQIRNRIQKLIDELPAGDQAKEAGEKEMARLEQLALEGSMKSSERQ